MEHNAFSVHYLVIIVLLLQLIVNHVCKLINTLITTNVNAIMVTIWITPIFANNVLILVQNVLEMLTNVQNAIIILK